MSRSAWASSTRQAAQIDTASRRRRLCRRAQTEFAFAYDLPYTGTTLSVPYKADYPTGQVMTLVPPNMLGAQRFRHLSARAS